jgi:hypothetical protein
LTTPTVDQDATAADLSFMGAERARHELVAIAFEISRHDLIKIRRLMRYRLKKIEGYLASPRLDVTKRAAMESELRVTRLIAAVFERKG